MLQYVIDTGIHTFLQRAIPALEDIHMMQHCTTQQLNTASIALFTLEAKKRGNYSEFWSQTDESVLASLPGNSDFTLVDVSKFIYRVKKKEEVKPFVYLRIH